MATGDRSSRGLPQVAEPGVEGEPHLPTGRELTETNRFAYAALCGVSLSQLFPEPEQRSFCTDFVAGLVKWLDLSEAVLPTMTAFASGLGGEGADMFAQILLKDPILKDDPLVITQDLLSFSLKDGRYDARARVLIRHVTSLLRVPLEELDLLEETFLKSLKETKEEESEMAEASRKKKENRRKWKRYLLIGLATLGGGTVIGTFSAPWAALAHSCEQYCLAWEAKYLMELGNALETILSGLANIVAQEALKYTVLSGLVAALTWPASLLSVANVIDNPWGVCLHRSAEVGKHLAHILLSRQQGRRPVTLIGFSLGARVIYFCLQEMAQEKDCQGIIEDVVLLGAPVEGEAKHWEPFRKVVSGRIINGYCSGDWLLSFVYRTSSVKLRVAGLQPVLLQDKKVENVDLSSMVSGHLDYARQMGVILKAVGIHTKPSCDEKGLLLAPGSPPQEEPGQAAAPSSSDKTTNQDGQTQGPTSPLGDTPKAATSLDPSQAQVPVGPDQSEGASLPASASPAASPPLCSHGMGPSPLGCPDCASETQGSCPGLD
ncbi:transmembrane and coiled-coil domain-containing protein 4 isoform X4 [Eubalaena glacialis]|uniref:transmembrane and coiled-coil domain-containing protein 4 isoform X4 n=1 Tax=Eubalaena glacialis TaxID=27606 RepID=UPI002A5A3E2F|nr:transmembrane and coiled-coil domain-containing protein 4 isoform X4 [Eubalaena glacialis]